MAREEFTVRITRKGEIFIEVEGMPVRRVKDLIKYFEETVGPVRQLDPDGGDATGQVEIDAELGREEEDEAEAARDPHRLRREDD